LGFASAFARTGSTGFAPDVASTCGGADVVGTLAATTGAGFDTSGAEVGFTGCGFG